MKRTGGKSPPTQPCSLRFPGFSERRAQTLKLLPGGTMNWQRLWLGFLLPLTVSCRAVGPGEKEAAMVSLLGKPDPGWGRDGGTAP